jgi:hypothetical protein
MNEFPSAQIVSKVFGTPTTGQAWLEQDAGVHQHVRCTKCGLYELAPGMAPGLLRLRQHAVVECGLPEESTEP